MQALQRAVAPQEADDEFLVRLRKLRSVTCVVPFGALASTNIFIFEELLIRLPLNVFYGA